MQGPWSEKRLLLPFFWWGIRVCLAEVGSLTLAPVYVQDENSLGQSLLIHFCFCYAKATSDFHIGWELLNPWRLLPYSRQLWLKTFAGHKWAGQSHLEALGVLVADEFKHTSFFWRTGAWLRVHFLVKISSVTYIAFPLLYREEKKVHFVNFWNDNWSNICIHTISLISSSTVGHCCSFSLSFVCGVCVCVSVFIALFENMVTTFLSTPSAITTVITVTHTKIPVISDSLKSLHLNSSFVLRLSFLVVLQANVW